MLALGPQQSRQPVALLLWSAARKNLVEIPVAAALGPPDLTEVNDHVAYRGLDAIAGEARAQEADYLPVLPGQG
jgi:hypothetical protein